MPLNDTLYEQQNQPVRNAARVLGPFLMCLGVGLTAIGVISFFSAFNSPWSGPPAYFWCAFLGIPILGIGSMITKVGYLRSIFRYVAGETAPVHRDTFNFVAQGVKPGVRDLAQAVAEGLTSGHTSQTTGEATAKFCTQCGASATMNSRFCSQCGTPFEDRN